MSEYHGEYDYLSHEEKQAIKREIAEQHLQMFYEDLQEWVERGAKQSWYYRFYRKHLRCFREHYGLCDNLKIWCEWQGFDYPFYTLREQFKKAGKDDYTPFNRGYDDYTDEGAAGGRYKNAERLAWIREHAV